VLQTLSLIVGGKEYSFFSVGEDGKSPSLMCSSATKYI